MIQSLKNVSLAEYTYYRIGGIAREVYFPERTSEMLELVQMLISNGSDYFIIGGGTNVLVGDGYWDGAVIITTHMNSFEATNQHLVCGSGIETSKIAEIALDYTKTGLEFLYKLPGSIGGALAGNARFDNKSISDILISVLAVHPQLGTKRFKTSEMNITYKRTGIIHEGWIICELSLSWKNGDTDTVRKRMEEIERFRTENHHFDFPSCGCVFKNDHKNNIQAGRLIDSLGLKGLSVGDARVSPYHANFIINTGNATARDVLELIRKVEQTVLEKTGITLILEVRTYGNFL